MTRLKIYFLCGSRTPIKPTSGDQITELSIIKCLSIYHDVYYNNEKVEFDNDGYGLTNTKVEKPNQSYDIYWIRNNDDILLNCDGFKVRCGAPYNKKAYQECDVILTYSKSWEKNLIRYNTNRKPSDGLYPEHDIIIPKNIISIYQTINEQFYLRITLIQKENIRRKLFGEDVDFVIAHFGRVSETCYPHNLLKAFPKIVKKYPNKKIKLLFCGNKNHFKKEIVVNHKDIVIHDAIDHQDIHKYIQSMDLITSDYNSPTADWGGCMHIIEAMACGIPILCGNFDVRIEQLGKKYPYFWNKNDSDYNIKKNMIKIISINIEKKYDLKDYLIDRSKLFTVEKNSEELNEKLSKVFKKKNNFDYHNLIGSLFYVISKTNIC